MCSHVTAALLFAQKVLSRTDFPSVWSRPNSDNLDGSKTIDDVWLPPLKTEKSLKNEVSADSLSALKIFLDRKQQFGLHWLLSDEPKVKNI
jgi:hypothetical protein